MESGKFCCVNIKAIGPARSARKDSLSQTLYKSAWMLADKSKDLEDQYKKNLLPRSVNQENIGYAAAAVIMAVSALDAATNQILQSAIDGNHSAFSKLTSEQVLAIAEIWPDVMLERTTTKCFVAVNAIGVKPMNRGNNPYQITERLYELRNALTHYSPEWDFELDKHALLEQALKKKFCENQISADALGSMPWFPGRCLGAGCAEWACKTVYDFHLAFIEYLGASSHLPARKISATSQVETVNFER